MPLAHFHSDDELIPSSMKFGVPEGKKVFRDFLCPLKEKEVPQSKRVKGIYMTYSFLRVLRMRRDPEFYSKLVKLAAPMAVQQLLMSSLFIIDTIIVSSLGDAYIAGVGQANQISFLMRCSFSAIASGGAVFAAQFWGKNQDTGGVRRAFTGSMLFGGIIAFLFFVIAVFFGYPAMHILAKDPRVIEIGRNYLQIAGYAFLLQVFSAMLSSILKATGSTRIPMIASISSVFTNIVLDIIMVYGYFGFPRMEERGAALATVIASVVDIGIMVMLARKAQAPISLRKSDFVPLDKVFSRKFIKIVAPILTKDQLWSLGVLLYSITFSYMGTAAIAAFNVFATVGEVMNIFFVAVGSAGGILIGHLLGASEIEKAKNYSWRLLRLMFLSGIVLCPVLFFGRGLLLMPFPNLTAEALDYAGQALLLTSFVIWAKGINFTNMNGILRAGGDTVAAAAIDIGSLWGLGVPLTMGAGMLLHLPFRQVFAMTCLEELFKAAVSIWRVSKYKWARRLV